MIGARIQDLLNLWLNAQIGGVQFWSDNNIAKVAAVDSGYGAIFHKKGLGVYRGQPVRPEKERNTSLFADVVTWSERYQAFTLDQTRCASARYEMVNMAHDA